MSETRTYRRNPYHQIAGRLVVFLAITTTLLVAILALGEANPAAAQELTEMTLIEVGPMAVEILSVPVYLLWAWTFAPILWCGWDKYGASLKAKSKALF